MQIKKTEFKTGSRRWLVIDSRHIRLNRVAFALVMMITTFFLLWPGYNYFASATPFILGLPLSFAWVVLWVIIGFAAMLALYISDNKDPETD